MHIQQRPADACYEEVSVLPAHILCQTGLLLQGVDDVSQASQLYDQVSGLL